MDRLQVQQQDNDDEVSTGSRNMANHKRIITMLLWSKKEIMNSL